MVQPIYYMQTDSKWKNENYSAKGEKKTIGSSGCGVACTAMIIATLKDKNITPVDTAKWSMEHGYKAFNQGTYYSYFVPQLEEYGIECKRLNHVSVYGKPESSYYTEVLKALKNGDWVIACAGKGLWTSSGHFIIAYGYENGYVYINDPNSKASKRTKAEWSTFTEQMKYLWVVTVPESFKKSNTSTISKKTMYRVQVGSYSIEQNAKNFLKKVQKDIPDAFITEVNGQFKIQVGAYSVKSNATKQVQRIKKLGYGDAFITKA